MLRYAQEIWWDHRHNYFCHISLLSVMTFWQIFLFVCHHSPFILVSLQKKKKKRISNGISFSITVILMKRIPFLHTDLRRSTVTFWGVRSSFDLWITLYEESQRANTLYPDNPWKKKNWQIFNKQWIYEDKNEIKIFNCEPW